MFTFDEKVVADCCQGMSHRPTTSSNTAATASDSKDKSSADDVEKRAITEFKRSGAFDRIRKETLHQWESSKDGIAFLSSLQAIVKADVERDPSLLARDRGKAATLIGGSVERSQVYPDARLAAAKNIFQTEAFKQRVYDALKQYFPENDNQQQKEDKHGTDEARGGEVSAGQTTKSAHEAAMDFIKREEGS